MRDSSEVSLHETIASEIDRFDIKTSNEKLDYDSQDIEMVRGFKK